MQIVNNTGSEHWFIVSGYSQGSTRATTTRLVAPNEMVNTRMSQPTSQRHRRLPFAVFISVAVVVAALSSAAADSNSRVEKFIKSSVKIQSIPPSLTPSLSTLASPSEIKTNQGSSWIRPSCSPQLNATIAAHPVPCWYGDPHGVKTVVLYGDSNAGNWIPALDAVTKLLKYRLAVFAFPSCATPFVPETKTGAGYFPIPFNGTVDGPVWTQCATWHAAVGPAAAALKPSAVIAVSGPWMYSGREIDENAWIKGFSEMFSALTKGHSTVKRILLGSSPIMPEDVPICLSEHQSQVQACAEHYTFGTGYYGGILARDVAIAQATNATLIPVTPLFCIDDDCSPIVKNYVVFVDQDHTTIAYSTYLEGILYSELQSLLN
jgi:hypothetical protein